MAQYFITGIGTEVGKTFLTAALLHQFPQFRAIKPVLSGFDLVQAEGSDAGQLLLAMGREMNEDVLDAIAPWRFVAPLSPHLAAAKEGKVVDQEVLVSFCQRTIKEHQNLLIEGVGGIMVPITPDWLVLDWMKALGLPIILVSSSYLGAINHTLLSIETLKAHGLTLHAIVISQSPPETDTGLNEMRDAIAPFCPEQTQLITLPRVEPSQTPWKQAASLLSLKL